MEVLKSSDAKVEHLVTDLAKPEQMPSKRPGPLRVASYNLYNLFPAEMAKSRRKAKAQGKKTKKRPVPSEEQLDALGEMILGVDADAIAFQEVHSESVLKDLFKRRVNAKLGKKRQYTTFICLPGNDQRGINVAVVTRLAVWATMSHRDHEFGPRGETIRFSRDILGVQLYATKTESFLLYVAHLKSKMGGKPADRKRGLEAKEVVELITEPLFGGAPPVASHLVLAGDMNSSVHEPPITTLKEDARLTDVLDELGPHAITWSTRTGEANKRNDRLDYLLVSPSMHGLFVASKIHDDDKELAATASDHFPVSATFKLGS